MLLLFAFSMMATELQLNREQLKSTVYDMLLQHDPSLKDSFSKSTMNIIETSELRKLHSALKRRNQPEVADTLSNIDNRLKDMRAHEQLMAILEKQRKSRPDFSKVRQEAIDRHSSRFRSDYNPRNHQLVEYKPSLWRRVKNALPFLTRKIRPI